MVVVPVFLDQHIMGGLLEDLGRMWTGPGMAKATHHLWKAPSWAGTVIKATWFWLWLAA